MAGAQDDALQSAVLVNDALLLRRLGDSLRQCQKDKLHTLQWDAILSITGTYQSTKNSKFLDLLGLLEINEEIEFRSQTNNMDSLEWRQKRAELIAGHVYEGSYGTSFEFRLDESIS